MGATIREIARKSGLSTATVSLALRGTGRMSKKTREKVVKLAQSLGYQAHPLFSRAFSLARQPSEKRYRETIALIVEWETESATSPEHQREIHAGAMRRASDMGYKLESFVVSGKAGDQRQVSRILQARGIRGMIIIPRLSSQQPRLRFDWEHFAPVEIGWTLWDPRNLNHVETAGYPKIIEALHLLKKAGYRRIGMAVEPPQNRHQNGVYYAAYMFTQLRLPQSERIPILSPNGPWNEKNFRRWFERYKPDVLFIHGVVAGTVLKWIKNMKLKVPDDVSLFCANIIQNTELTGLRRDYVTMGRCAVEMVSLLLESEELGIAGNPRYIQVGEFWQLGKTLSRPIDHHITQDGFLVQGTLHAAVTTKR